MALEAVPHTQAPGDEMQHQSFSVGRSTQCGTTDDTLVRLTHAQHLVDDVRLAVEALVHHQCHDSHHRGAAIVDLNHPFARFVHW